MPPSGAPQVKGRGCPVPRVFTVTPRAEPLLAFSCEIKVSRPKTDSLSSCLVPPAALPSAILTLRFSPHQRGIYCDDQSINYPYRRDTISHGTMAAVTITCSIVIVSPAVYGRTADAHAPP